MFQIQVENLRNHRTEIVVIDYLENGWPVGCLGDDVSIPIDEPDIDAHSLRIVRNSACGGNLLSLAGAIDYEKPLSA